MTRIKRLLTFLPIVLMSIGFILCQRSRSPPEVLVRYKMSSNVTFICRGTWYDDEGDVLLNVSDRRYVYDSAYGSVLLVPSFDLSQYLPSIHAVTYNCRNSTTGELQRSFTLSPIFGVRRGRSVSPPPPPVELVDRFSASAVSSGAALSVHCSARHALSLRWQRDGLPLSLQGHQPAPLGHHNKPNSANMHAPTNINTNTLTQSLNFDRIQPEDAGLYTCIASSLDNITEVSHSARIDVYGPPYIRPMSTVQALLGSRVAIYCPYYGFPISKIQWEHNGVTVDNNYVSRTRGRMRRGIGATQKIIYPISKTRNKRGFTSNEDGMLVVNEVSDDSSGLYTCAVSNPAGEMARRAFELIVMEPPVLTDLIFANNLQEGQIAQTTCSIKGGDTPVHFSWLKDGFPIPSSLRVEEKSSEVFSVLLIKKVGLQHCGTYTCVATNRAARVNQSAELFIKVAPKWIEEPQNKSIIAGRPGHISCSASGYPQPQVHWMKRDDNSGSWRPVLELMGSGLMSLSNGSLTFELVSPKDEGVYSCRVENGVGHALSKNIWVTVNRPVTFDSVSANLTTRIGQSAAVTCEAFGDQPIRISWTHNGRPVDFMSHNMKINSHQTVRGAISEVYISSSGPPDAGEYICRAANPHGIAQHSIQLVVQEPPLPPVELGVEAVLSRWARLGWLPPSGVPPPAYLLQYQPTHQAGWDAASQLNVSSAGSSRQRLELPGLRPATPYSVRLCSVGQTDFSAFTRPLLFTTLEEAPSGAPQSVQVSSGFQAGELQISWLPPPAHTNNGLLTGYIIKAVPQISEQADEYTRVVKFGAGESTSGVGGVLQSSLGGLLSGVRYSLVMSCYNSAGTGPTSPPVYHTTKEGAPSQSPAGVQCSSVSGTALKVSWQPLAQHLQGGNMQGYSLLYVTDGGHALNSSTPHGVTWSQLAGLHKFRNYTVRVAAHSRHGLGPLSNAVTCSTQEDLPSAPADIKALVVTSTSIVVSWQPPQQPNGRLSHYTVYMRPLNNGGSASVSSYVVPLSPSGPAGPAAVGGLAHALRGLQQGRRYEVWVTATTGAGEGEASHKAQAEPQDRVPAGVSSLGGGVWLSAGREARLPCRALGSPQPRTVWYHNQRVITHHPRFTRDKDDSLIIHEAEPALEGNYTCQAKNLFGWDSVSYLVFVLEPPGVPELRAQPAQQALLLQYEPPITQPSTHNYTTHVIGYTLRWKESASATWQSEEMSGSTAGSRRLGGLRCGTQYDIQLLARAAAASSSPALLSLSTLGSEMIAPEGPSWIWSNSSCLILQTSSWQDGQCGAARWSVEYRQVPNRLWLQHHGIPEQDGSLVLSGLQAARWYQLRVTATNQAGSTTRLYSRATTTETGEEIAPPSDSMDTSVLVMVCSCILLLICMLICIFAAIQKHRHKVLCGSVPVYKSNGAAVALPRCEAEQPPCPRLYSSPICPPKISNKAPTEMFEISPYAQFTMGFQTFGHAENQDRPGYVKSKHGVYSTGDTSFQGCSESDDSDSLSKSATIAKGPNKMCRVQYHR